MSFIEYLIYALKLDADFVKKWKDEMMFLFFSFRKCFKKMQLDKDILTTLAANRWMDKLEQVIKNRIDKDNKKTML